MDRINQMKAIALLGALPYLYLLLLEPTIAVDGDPHYPTSDEALLYVLACMEMNGRDADGLRKCSCAINAMMAPLPYEPYSEAILVFAMRQASEEKASIYRDTAQ
jgi:hypothetical protein